MDNNICHLNQFRSSAELGSKWIELNHLGSVSTDKLLLQKVVTVLYESINRHRSESVISALQICEEYRGETLRKRPFLTPAENNIVAYIAGYVCRKTRDRLKRNYDTRSSSQTAKWKCERLDRIIKLLNQMVPGVAKQTPAMTYPNDDIVIDQRRPFSSGLFNIYFLLLPGSFHPSFS